MAQVKIAVVVFDQDPEALKRYQAHYQTASKGSAKRYEYLTDLDVQPQDLVVVNTPHGGYTVVQVLDTTDILDQKFPSLKWVVDKVDVSAFNERQERANRLRNLATQLEAKAEIKRREQRYEELFKDDPEAMLLVQELKKLQAG